MGINTYINNATFTNCYFAGSWVGNNADNWRGPIASLTQYHNDPITNNGYISCFYDSTKSTYTYYTPPVAKGLTSIQFANSENFTDWDFENTWVIKNGYPELKIFIKN